MDLHAAFLQDIATNPDDDTPRLIYADWLDDQGDADRAQFIRVQCRLATLQRYDLARYDLEGEEAALLKKHGTKWRKPLARITARIVFRRGFPDLISLPAKKFIEMGQIAFSIAPTLREYRVLQPFPAWDALLRCEALSHVRSLDAGHHRLGVARVQALARCPHLSNLHELSLTSSAMRPSCMTSLAASRYFTNVRTLDLMSNQLGDGLVELLATSPSFQQVTDLNLSVNNLTTAGIERLARWPQAARLESLALREYQQGDALAQAFAAHDWPALRRLDLDLHGMTAVGLQALGRCSSLANVRTLNTHVPANLLPVLATAPSLNNLEDLNVHGQVNDAALWPLVHSPLLAQLRSLNLCAGGVDSMKALLMSPHAAGLRELLLHDNSVREHLRALAEATHLVNLRKLTITMTRLTTDDVRLIANMPHLAGLVTLVLFNCRVQAAAARELIASPYLKRLRCLNLRNNMSPVLRGSIVDELHEHFGPGVVTVG